MRLGNTSQPELQPNRSLAVDTNLPPVAGNDLILKHLRKLSAVFDRVLSPELIRVYIEALGDLTPNEWDLATRECIRRCVFFPKPAELRARLLAALEKMPRQKEADADCKLCLGDGWKPITKDGRTWAVICDCRKRKVA
jgi:hypothetical protein